MQIKSIVNDGVFPRLSPPAPYPGGNQLEMVSSLFAVEKANHEMCKKGIATRLLEHVIKQPTHTNGVVQISSRGGGFGNELNTLINGMLISMALNRTPCLNFKRSRTMRFLASPALDASRDPARIRACAAMANKQIPFEILDGIESQQNVDKSLMVVTPRGNHNPFFLKNNH